VCANNTRTLVGECSAQCFRARYLTVPIRFSSRDAHPNGWAVRQRKRKIASADNARATAVVNPRRLWMIYVTYRTDERHRRLETRRKQYTSRDVLVRVSGDEARGETSGHAVHRSFHGELIFFFFLVEKRRQVIKVSYTGHPKIFRRTVNFGRPSCYRFSAIYIGNSVTDVRGKSSMFTSVAVLYV
jgi:hypothetical protein